MNTVSVLYRLLGGLALGLLFYGGLWYTISSLPVSRHPALLAVGSFWLRTLAVLAGFLFLIDSRWDNALISIAGFTIGRFTISRLSMNKETKCT